MFIPAIATRTFLKWQSIRFLGQFVSHLPSGNQTSQWKIAGVLDALTRFFARSHGGIPREKSLHAFRFRAASKPGKIEVQPVPSVHHWDIYQVG